ncbi:zinc finger-containing ubiquitin peptidase 1-like isoform X2 [Ptychodera flava]|uniref:zinc finger-containing ubiquitin peptidase 1-like isoform X2 n=1 Tax=Ptychodera flava TaxID=63121 RepID=UPI003969E0E6
MASCSFPVYDCAICGQESLTEDEMKTHMLVSHVENSISCPLCDLSDITEEEMTLHINAVHFNDVYSPKKCNRNSDWQTNIEKLKTSFTNFVTSPFKKRPKKEVPVESTGTEIKKDEPLELERAGQVHPQTGAEAERISMDLQSASNVEFAECPVCSRSDIRENDLSSHVEAHFEECDDDDNNEPLGRMQDLHVAKQQNYATANRKEQNTDVIEVQKHNDSDSNDAFISECLQEEERNFEQQLKDQLMARQIQEEERQMQERREREEFKRLQAMYGMDDQGSFRRQSDRNRERAVWNGEMDVASYHEHQRQTKLALSRGVDDGKSRTTGIIDQLIGYYGYGRGPRGVQFARLSVATDHYGSTYGDKGWGCGYRNLQMLLSSMLHEDQYKDKVFNGRDTIPSIPKLQQLIESAWEKGFDTAGSQQLGGKVFNTRKWIGATEVVAMLSSLYVRCTLIDFHHPTADDGTHPDMFAWVKRYFDEGSRHGYTQTNKTPLYLQHEGHSRTIIGYEQLKDGSMKLLLFDPGQPTKTMKEFLSGHITGQTMRFLRKPLTYMKSRQYQIVSVDGILSERDYQRSKVIQSERIP